MLAHGVFDFLHPGHIEHLRQARAMGDRLVVSITASKYVNKGPGRPLLDNETRMKMLFGCRYVDDVFLCEDISAVPAINALKPDVYVKGPDYANRVGNDGKLIEEKAAVEKYGGCIAFTIGETMSSTHLINNSKGNRPINRTPGEVIEWLDKAISIETTIIGEAILDEYIYVEPVGRVTKEEIISFQEVGGDRYAGGRDIIAANLVEAFKSKLHLHDTQSIIKRRYVSKPFHRKVFSLIPGLFEVAPYYVPEAFPSAFVLVADFGHGLIRGKSQAVHIRERAKFLALTVQSNSLNWGYNLLTKWPGSDYFVVDEPELRLAKSDRWTPIKDLLDEEFRRLKAKIGIVTQGHRGCLSYDGKEFLELPALADKIVDRMGAGDAFLAWSAPLAYVGAPLDIVAFVGSVAAGIKVGKLGNQVVMRKEMEAWIMGLLK